MKGELMKSSKQKICDESGGLKFHPALKEFFGYCFFKSALRMRAMLAESLCEHDLIPPHMGIMYLLKKSPPLNQITLGEELGIDKATMVKLIDKLESLKLVERNSHPEDRRVKLIQLTKKGHEKIDLIYKIGKQVEKEFLAPLSEEERAIIRKIIPQLVKT
jgi:DNA-binding MarR family transcriptional regulator